MKFKQRTALLVAGLVAGALLGAGPAMVTPAGAAVQGAATAINWKSAWNQEIKPRADRRYFTKEKANARFYTKAQSDARYAPYPELVRGVIGNVGQVDGAGDAIGTGYSFGVSFDEAPSPHVIAPGDPLPTGCLGTPAQPDALPGHLCIFANIYNNVGADTVCASDNTCPAASPFGFLYLVFAAEAGTVDVSGAWAARPAASVTAGKIVQPRASSNSGQTGR